MKIELEANIPEGYEATGEFREPLVDEWFVNVKGDAVICLYGERVGPRIILRVKFNWPEWVKPGTWYARDSLGHEWLFATEPQLSPDENGWVAASGRRASLLDMRGVLDFPKVTQSDWKKSKMQKPQRELVYTLDVNQE